MKTKHLMLIFSAFTLAASQAFISNEPVWNPNAGYVAPWTEGAQVNASSNPVAAGKVLDGDVNTAWQSEPVLPTGFIAREGLNIFLKKDLPSSFGENPNLATDGDLSTPAEIRTNPTGTHTWHLAKAVPIKFLSIKSAVRSNLNIAVLTQAGETLEIGTVTPADNYLLKRFTQIGELPIVAIVFSHTIDFQLFEIGAMSTMPTESLIVDFKQRRPIGQIISRHWAGDSGAISTKIYLSENGSDWQEVCDLDPRALHPVTVVLPIEINARYLKAEHTVPTEDWKNVFFWELKAYDRFGPFGPKPEPIQGHSTIKEMLGVNGYWSFGTDQYSDLLAPDGGPYRFKPVAAHLRNYHDMTWDLRSPDEAIDFDKMAKGGGTPATEWLNWDREYRAWHDGAGMNVQASLQFYRFKPEEWKKPRESARQYAKAYARHFGQKSGNGLVCSIEAGNEPWHYPAAVYREILLGMAEGAEEGDPTVEVFPCALQAVDPLAEQHGPWKNYIGDRITPATSKLLDGINIHCYSYLNNGEGKRQAVHPEHPASSFWEMLNAIRWRNQNMPGKKIYLSEWGWDCDGAGEDCTHQECVSEAAAAHYAVRGALIASRLGIDRATWFFHANDKTPSSLYTRSGLLGSANTGFKQKKPFHAMASLVKWLGDKYFLSVVQENEIAWVYKFGTTEGKATHFVAWLPINTDTPEGQAKTIHLPQKISSAWLLDGTETRLAIKPGTKTIELPATGVPVLLSIE